MESTVLVTPLHACHLELNAKMVPFAGWEMPVQYQSVIAESKAVRLGAGMFDVSHMARLWFKGDRVIEYLEWITANDVSKLEDGHGQYSFFPNETGGVVDDIIVYRVSATTFRMVVNASNHGKDVAWMKKQNTFGVEIIDESDATAMIAVQGPKATDIVAGMSPDGEALKALPFFGTLDTTVAGIPCFAPVSGYTGEEGFELVCKASDGPALWKALLEAGVAPCGLASRDALRVEAGLPLYGHELNDEMSPVAAGLNWVISKTKAFIGSEFINAARENGTSHKLQGIRLNSKRLMAPGMKVFVHGSEAGEISSGVFSPLLDCGIAFAFLKADVPVGAGCTVDIRGTHEAGTVVNKRFFKRAK